MRELFGEECVKVRGPTMGGEDLSTFLQVAPGLSISLERGTRRKGITYPHHHPRLTVDEDALPVGLKRHVGVALKLLALNPWED